MKFAKHSNHKICLITKITVLAVLLVCSNKASSQFYADFEGTPKSGYLPLQVSFTDKSEGVITSWQWSFQGATPSSKTGEGPHTVIYNEPGTFTVTLEITGGATGQMQDTETKQNYITVHQPEKDFGDAPEASEDTTKGYHTLLSHNGAYHIIKQNIFLGSLVDAESDGQPTQDATGDDNDNQGNDDDGAKIPKLFIGDSAKFTVTVHGNGYLNAWLDFNQDWDWLDEGEHIFQSISLEDGQHYLSVGIPDTAVAGTSYVRFRYSTDSTISFKEEALDGEVEDYQVEIFAITGSIIQDSLALVSLYNNTDGDNWTHNDNWLIGKLDTWWGVGVSSLPDCRVTTLFLGENNLNGSIPDEIGNLTELTNLDFLNNDLYGPVPSCIWDFAELRTLCLEGNHNLTGRIHPNIGNMIHLKVLKIGINNFSGPIPEEIGSCLNLVYLAVESNELEGPIPTELWNLSKLEELWLYNNQLTGSIPSEIGNLINLELLFLERNQFTGVIPYQIGNLLNLEILTLGYNQFEGSIPPEIGNLSNLWVLELHHNQLSGTIPPEIGNLNGLHVLLIGDNPLSGSIPKEIYDITTLTQLNIFDTNIEDTISIKIGNLRDLMVLNLSGNKLYGSVPSQITNLSNLIYFQVQNNQLNVLPDLSSITGLEELCIQENQFTFEDIEPNIDVPYFIYAPQDSVGTVMDTIFTVGSDAFIVTYVEGTANQYQWTKDGIDIPGANNHIYDLSPVSSTDAGTYGCRITNTIATELTLYRRSINITVEGEEGIREDKKKIPDSYALYQNHPNPFNLETEIIYDLPKSTYVTLTVYNMLGQPVRTLVDSKIPAGSHKIVWDAQDNTGQVVPSGIYVFILKSDSYTEKRKALLMK